MQIGVKGNDFLSRINEVQGLILDFSVSRLHYVNALNSILPGHENFSVDFGDESPNVTMPDGPGTGASDHRTTKREIVERNLEDGFNEVLLSNMGVVYVYSLWEHHFRKQIESELRSLRVEPPITGKGKNKGLRCDPLGDLRYIRISILHHDSIATKECSKCLVHKWFSPGQRIVINKEHFVEIKKAVQLHLGMLYDSNTTYPPLYD